MLEKERAKAKEANDLELAKLYDKKIKSLEGDSNKAGGEMPADPKKMCGLASCYCTFPFATNRGGKIPATTVSKPSKSIADPPDSSEATLTPLHKATKLPPFSVKPNGASNVDGAANDPPIVNGTTKVEVPTPGPMRRDAEVIDFNTLKLDAAPFSEGGLRATKFKISTSANFFLSRTLPCDRVFLKNR